MTTNDRETVVADDTSILEVTDSMDVEVTAVTAAAAEAAAAAAAVAQGGGDASERDARSELAATLGEDPAPLTPPPHSTMTTTTKATVTVTATATITQEEDATAKDKKQDDEEDVFAGITDDDGASKNPKNGDAPKSADATTPATVTSVEQATPTPTRPPSSSSISISIPAWFKQQIHAQSPDRPPSSSSASIPGWFKQQSHIPSAERPPSATSIPGSFKQQQQQPSHTPSSPGERPPSTIGGADRPQSSSSVSIPGSFKQESHKYNAQDRPPSSNAASIPGSFFKPDETQEGNAGSKAGGICTPIFGEGFNSGRSSKSPSPPTTTIEFNKETMAQRDNAVSPASSTGTSTATSIPDNYDEASKALKKGLKGLPSSVKRILIDLERIGGQEELLKDFMTYTSPTIRKHLADQIEALDHDYTDGGLVGYIQNARKLLEDSQNGVNPLEGWTPSVPVGEVFELGTPEYRETEAMGIKELGSVGFVLVAGGLGERLGYNNIKVGLPTELITGTCYLQHYIEYILAVQKKFAPIGRPLPLCIMTSGDTHSRTVELLEKNHYFGMKKSQITFIQQGQGVPALTNNQASIAMQPGNPHKILTKPHGHGDVHELMHRHRVAKDWADVGIKWTVFFQDTNGLAFHSLPLMLGVSLKLDLVMNSLATPRKAKQAIGAITKLTHVETGQVRTINVEYNQLDPMLRASGFPCGDVNDPDTHRSPYPGNINQLLFRLDSYVEALERTKGLMPEFVNPKYKDEAKTVFKKPTRLECMMQDFPTVFEGREAKRVGFTSVPSNLCFSPVKNATEDGAKLQEKGIQPGTAATGEADQYGAFRTMLRKIGCTVSCPKEETYLGIRVMPGPEIVFKPDFACCPGELEDRILNPSKVKISSRSTLVIRGDVRIESLELDGALVIDCKEGHSTVIRDKVVKNRGWVRVRETNNKDPIIQMRGYKYVRKDCEYMNIGGDDSSACVIM